MKIERIRIEGFGALRDLDLAWPEGSVLLAVDPNETGKTTLCEAIVAALYGLPKTRGAAGRVREVRRPRSGAPLRVGLDVLAGGIRWSVDRDLEVGTIRVVDRDRGLERTQEFLRPGNRDAFGETVTGGLTEELFRATAYVSQNVLDRDSLDAGLTVELARIADSGGGEASVVRALKTLDAVLLDMPEPAAGAKISVDTEIARLGRRVEALKQRRADLAARRTAAAQASARLSGCARAHEEARRTAEIAAFAEVLAHRRALARRRETLASALAKQREAESEARALAPEAELFSDGALATVDRLREERGNRPQVLEAARAAYAEGLRLAAREAEEAGRRFGPAARLGEAERAGLEEMLRAELATSRDLAEAERFLEERWNSLRRDGLAEDFVRLEALPPEERGFLAGAEEERAALELEGVKLDRRVADAGATAAIAAGERAQRVKLARSLVLAAALLVPFVAWLAWRFRGRARLHDGFRRGLRPVARALRRHRLGARDPLPRRRRGPGARGGGREPAQGRRAPQAALQHAPEARPPRARSGLSRHVVAAQGAPPRARCRRAAEAARRRDGAPRRRERAPAVARRGSPSAPREPSRFPKDFPPRRRPSAPSLFSPISPARNRRPERATRFSRARRSVSTARMPI